MTRVPFDQLPAHVQDKVRMQLGEDIRTRTSDGHRQGAAGPPVPYRCVACDERFMWTTRGDASPAAIDAHQQANPTHRRYEAVIA